jgi:MoxR-like ATPase
MPLVRVTIQRSSDIDDIAGHVELVAKGDVNITEFFNGRVTKSWMSECVLLIDEPNVGPDEIWQFLRSMFDNSRELLLDMDKGQRIARNDFCYPILAINPAWDAKYVGTNELNYADVSRLEHIYVNMPPEAIERDILIQWCQEVEYVPTAEDLDKVMDIAHQIRDLVAQGSLPISWNIREQIKVLQALKFFSLKRAYRLAITDALEPDTGQQITAIVQGYCA